MALISGTLLKLIDRLFRFRAGELSAPLEFSTESPVQPVYEVGRPAEIAAGYGSVTAPGLWLMGTPHAHAGGDEVFDTFNPRGVVSTALAPGIPLDKPLEFELWWLGAYAWSVTNGIIVVANLTAYYPSLPGQVIQTAELLYNAPARVSIPDAGAAAPADAGVQSMTNPVNAPVWLPNGTILNTRTSAAVATPGNIQVVSRIWVAPRGARPPGLA